MNPESRQAIESILMVADQPVEPTVLAQLLEVSKDDVEAACEELAAEYDANGRGFILVRVAGGYRFQSHPDLAPYVERFVLEGQSSRLSSAALETLAIVAYKQPISRMQVAAIRGVNVDGVLRTLQQRGYVDEVDRDPGPGNAVLFGTTSLFLERVGLNSLDDLPALADFVPGADVVEALEDGLRPEPAGEVAADAVAMAEVEAGLSAEADHEAAEGSGGGVADAELESAPDGLDGEDSAGGDAASAVDDVVAGASDGVAGASDGVAGASDGVAGAEYAARGVREPSEDESDPAVVVDLTGATDGVAGAEYAARGESELRDDESDPAAVVDLTETVDLEAAAKGARSQDLSPPLTTTIRHDVPDNVDPESPFRSTPGAGTGGTEIPGGAGMGLAQEHAPSPEAIEELNPNEG